MNTSNRIPAIRVVFQGAHLLRQFEKFAYHPYIYNLTEFPSTDQIQLQLFLPIDRIELCYYLSDKFVLNRGMFPFDLAFFCTTHVTSRKGNFLKLFYLQSQ